MLSVVINAKNEEKMIKTCLESVKWAEEILVVLNDSTDGTEKIIKQYTNKVFKVHGQDFAKVKNIGLEEVKGDWVLFVDADERVLEPLKDEILRLTSFAQDSKCSAFAISRRNIIFGTEVNYGPYKHDWVIRLVKRDKCRGWVGKVHEHLEFSGELGYTKNSLLHLTHRGVDHFVLKALEWSNIDARLRVESGHPKMSAWRFLRIFLSEVFNQGIARKGFFNGTVSMMDSILQAFSMYITYVRLWQLQQEKPIKKVYEEVDKKLMEGGFNYE